MRTCCYLSLAFGLALTSGPAHAQASAALPQILVAAKGTVETPPDTVTISFTLRGEGDTSDAALLQLKAHSEKIEGAVSAFLGPAYEEHRSELSIKPVHADDCEMESYGPARLTLGKCAITGYVAQGRVTLQFGAVEKAGTLVGLIGRSGAFEPQIESFGLLDASTARDKALRKALADARARAQMIAAGSGVRLGTLLRVQDADYREVEIAMPDPVPQSQEPPPSPVVAALPPIPILLKPAPVETSVEIMAAFAIAN